MAAYFSLLGFDLFNPFYVEEDELGLFDLAQAERTFLSNLRRMYRYQQSYYVEVVAGRGDTLDQLGALGVELLVMEVLA